MALIYPSGTDCSLSSQPTAVTVELLTEIWQSVLKRPAVRLDDDFFEIGGSPRLADLLFAQIAQKFRRELPSATIFHAPTIAALAAVFDQAVFPRFSPFVELKAGRQHPPILIAPGLDGRASFSGLAQLIRSEHPIYGMQAKGVDGLEDPLDSIEEMAEFYLGSLKDLQAEGPYILIGYSFGGLVALEMAQRLLEQSKQIALLVMIDAYPHPRYLSAPQRFQLGAQRTKRRILELKRRSLHEGLSYLREGIERRWHIVGTQSGSQASQLSLQQTTVRVKRKAYVALGRYRPRLYSGNIKFIKSDTDTYFPGNPVPVWAHLAEAFEVETVRGSHLNMVTTHFEGLAAVLTRYVIEAAGRG